MRISLAFLVVFSVTIFYFAVNEVESKQRGSRRFQYWLRKYEDQLGYQNDLRRSRQERGRSEDEKDNRGKGRKNRRGRREKIEEDEDNKPNRRGRKQKFEEDEDNDDKQNKKRRQRPDQESMNNIFEEEEDRWGRGGRRRQFEDIGGSIGRFEPRKRGRGRKPDRRQRYSKLQRKNRRRNEENEQKEMSWEKKWRRRGRSYGVDIRITRRFKDKNKNWRKEKIPMSPAFHLSRTKDGYVVKQQEITEDQGSGGFHWPDDTQSLNSVNFPSDGSISPYMRLGNTVKGPIVKELEGSKVDGRNAGVTWVDDGSIKTLPGRSGEAPISKDGSIQNNVDVDPLFADGTIAIEGIFKIKPNVSMDDLKTERHHSKKTENAKPNYGIHHSERSPQVNERLMDYEDLETTDEPAEDEKVLEDKEAYIMRSIDSDVEIPDKWNLWT